MTNDLANLFAADPHAQALVASGCAADHARINRGVQRIALGCCPCGLAPGAERCPICDGIMGSLGRHLREQGKTLAEIVDAERAVIAAARDQSLAFGDDVLPRDLADTLFHIAERVASQGTIDAAQVLRALAGSKPKPKPIPLHAPRPMNRHERRTERSRRRRT